MSTEKENTTHSTMSNEIVTTPELALYELDPQKQRFIHLYMTGNYTLAKIAELIGIHPNTASNWLKKEDMKFAIAEAQTEVHHQVEAQLKALTVKATHKLSSLIDSKIDGVALQAVKDILDRGGHKTVNEIKVDKTVTTIEQKYKELIDLTITDGEFEEVIDEAN